MLLILKIIQRNMEKLIKKIDSSTVEPEVDFRAYVAEWCPWSYLISTLGI